MCNLDQYGTDYNIRECYDYEGSHERTFWIYLLLRVLFQSSLLSIYSCIDGTILRHARDYNSDYAWVMVYNNIATLISPPIAGVLIKEAPEGSDGELITYTSLLLTEVEGEGGPDLAPQKFLSSQKFRHLMG